MSLKRRLRVVLIVMATVVVAVATIGTLLKGILLDWAIDQLESNYSLSITVAETDLSWSGRMTLWDLEITRDNNRIRCDQADGDVSIGAIVRGRLELSELRLSSCTVSRQPETQTEGRASSRGWDGRLEEMRELVQHLTNNVGIVHFERLDLQGMEPGPSLVSITDARIERTNDGVRLAGQLRLNGSMLGGEGQLEAHFGEHLRVEVFSDVGLIHSTSQGELLIHGFVVTDDNGLNLVLNQVESVAGVGPISNWSFEEVSVDSLPASQIEVAGGRIIIDDSQLALLLGAPAGPGSHGEDDEDGESFEATAAQRATQILSAFEQLSASRWPSFRLAGTNLELVTSQWGSFWLNEFHLEPDHSLSMSVAPSEYFERIEVQIDDQLSVTFEHNNVELANLADFFEVPIITDGRGRLSASLTVDPTEERISGVFQFDIESTITEPNLSELPIEGVRLAGRLDASVTARQATGDVILGAKGAVDINDIPTFLNANLASSSEGAHLEVAGGVLETVPCQHMWEAIPDAMLPNLTHDGMAFEGEAAPSFHASYQFGEYDSFELTTDGFPQTCQIVHVAEEFDPEQLNDKDYVHHVVEGVTEENIFVGPGVPGYTYLSTLPSYIPALMYLSEEIHFYENGGLSIGLINRGIRVSLPQQRLAYSGSTVTQQLVKNLFLTRSRTFGRKLEEAFLAWAMATVVERDRILELYLNCIEFAPNTYGIAAAAEHYFGIEPAQLTPLEAAYLAALKPSPTTAARHFDWGHSPNRGWWPARIETLLGRLVEYGEHITAEEAESYAPYIVVFPTSPNFSEVDYPMMERPGFVLNAVELPVVGF